MRLIQAQVFIHCDYYINIYLNQLIILDQIHIIMYYVIIPSAYMLCKLIFNKTVKYNLFFLKKKAVTIKTLKKMRVNVYI